MIDAPPTPMPPPPNDNPPRLWRAADFVLGLLAPIIASVVLGAVIPGVGILVALGGVIVAGIVIGVKSHRWGFLIGALTAIVAIPLIFFVYCLINPPNFH